MFVTENKFNSKLGDTVYMRAELRLICGLNFEVTKDRLRLSREN